MLIGFDASRAFIEEATGTENYSLNLLRALAGIDRKNRYRVYVRSGSQFTSLLRSGRAVHSSQLRKSVNRERITDSYVWPKNFEFVKIGPYRFGTQLGLAREIWKNPPDVLFIPAHTLPVVRRHNIRTVVTIHDLGVEYLPGYHQFSQRLYLDFASKYAARHASAIIAVSRATKSDLITRYGISEKKVFVVPEGVDTRFFKPQSKSKAAKGEPRQGRVDSVKRKYKIKGNYILFVGTVQPRKNLEFLIKVFSILVRSPELVVGRKDQKTTDYKLQTTNLVIAGKLGWDYADILAAPKKFGVEDKVKFLGYVPQDDLPSLYSGAVVLTAPSLFEGFDLPVLEALACGCGVIASKIPVHEEILAQLIVGNKQKTDIIEAGTIINSNDIDKWANVLYQSITQCKQISVNSTIINRLVAKFSWELSAKSAMEIFENL